MIGWYGSRANRQADLPWTPRLRRGEPGVVVHPGGRLPGNAGHRTGFALVAAALREDGHEVVVTVAVARERDWPSGWRCSRGCRPRACCRAYRAAGAGRAGGPGLAW
ncbi:hypothetical protein GCM10017559_43090 [Streptosporangium longisporum]|uniref:Uncharacterized protein n=1 Tax=Streptosporangium longisporum TaxID=46187 RepID=A0ABP6KPD5_9ACTN